MKELLVKPVRYAVPALDKALDVLEFLASQTRPLTQAEIAQGLGRSANEIYRILVNLEGRGYLIREEASAGYRISLKLYNLSHGIEPIALIRQVALPHMEDLAVKLGVSCYLSILYQSQTMVLIHANSPSPVSLNVREGSLFSTLNSVPGNVLLAHSNEDVKAMILAREASYETYTDKQKNSLNKRWQTIAETGIYSASSELADGVYEYSAIVGAVADKVIAALTIPSLSTTLIKNLDKDSVEAQVKQTAGKIAAQLSKA
ncbi:HTH domain-containing protein [Thalassotalea litorea]|uniref:HTH domain-containing protein n=1 Tax=Thalassotalea litorea TaxID=2020715 RepID=A0A5R9IPJ4_9GAMM|nr:helix-turn-helix domain-containing protein [Thalassotalea litorea]TLU65181.1 HTH domain-containing protein [Thalassotalea litorea]